MVLTNMSWEHHFNQSRGSIGVTVPKNEVGQIPWDFNSVSVNIDGVFGVYEGQRGTETIRITELPIVYWVSVENNQPQIYPNVFEPTITPADTGPNIQLSPKQKAGIGGGILLALAGLAYDRSKSQTSTVQAHRVFISHSWKYEDQFQEIKSLLDEVWGFEWYDHSVSSDEPIDAQLPNHLRSKLRDQIQSTHVVLVLAGMYTAHSEWMEVEIELAADMGKPVIGVIPPDNERAPKIVKQHATEIVPFDGGAILDAIRNHS